jgi:uncharacterized protein YbcI
MKDPPTVPIATSGAGIAQRVAEAAAAFQHQATGHPPASVSVVLNGETVVITLRGALTPAEMALSQTSAGAAQVREFHRQLFEQSAKTLMTEIERITGVAVNDAAASVEGKSGVVVHAFGAGSVVQVFVLAEKLPAERWDGAAESGRAPPTDSE